MLHHLSDAPGIGGAIKGEPEDFVVEEITAEGRRLAFGKRVRGRDERGGEYARFVLEKREWNTPQALQEIASRLRVGQKRFGYAGTKDRRAVTVQLCSAWGVEPEAFKALGIPGVKVNGAWRARQGVRLGDLSGNAFTIRVRGARPRSAQAVKKIFGELRGAFPNYFGSQRFGSVRANTHLVGKAILRGDLEGAAKNYLCFTEGETNAEALSARARLAKEMDFGEAVEYFPRHLKYERAMLLHLAEVKNDYAGALRSLPRGILLMFVHAFQSMLWNEALSERISAGETAPARGDFVCPRNRFGFP
ncbi:MAG: tRNA pseudouridine(13) synthase TruD, partial [Candidatus ainarchaeum sp.]|nr:tRNA pseudouridine(13) synthase TruD [Candidatus ainarchaeum sp.]